MATIITISQGYAGADGERKTNKIWRVVNTTLEDETMLMKSAFLPLYIYEDNIPEDWNKMVDEAFTRFFEKGMFLLEEHIYAMNNALECIGFMEVKLKEDNKYFQPTLPGKHKPCPQSWKNNGLARAKEMKAMLSDFRAGKINIDEYMKPNLLTQLLETEEEMKKDMAEIHILIENVIENTNNAVMRIGD